MVVHRWPALLPPGELGVVVHGPAVLARSPGIVLGLRCVFAQPGGLLLPAVVRATGVQAEAAHRRIARAEPAGAGSEPRLWAEIDGKSGVADAYQASASAGEDAYESDAWYWLGAVPLDRRLRLTVGWPESGLAESTTDLTLTGLDRLGDVVPLL
jgi:hypothetical protein